ATAGSRNGPRADRVSASVSGSEERQILLELVRGHLDAVVIPILPFELDVARVDVLAEAAEQELARRADLDGLAQRLRQLLDAGPLALLVGEVVEVLLHRRRQLVALLDPLEA